jgi:hypothetical protein
VKITCECVLILKREYIIVFSMDIELSINLIKTIVIDFIIVKLFKVCAVCFPFNVKGFSMYIFVFLCVIDTLA